MELGFALYFFLVFVLGGLTLLPLIAYLFVAFVIQRTSWSRRTPIGKAMLVTACATTTALLLVPTRMIWATRVGALPGSYMAAGAWGSANLEIHKDGSFLEQWSFLNEYTGKFEGTGSSQGVWKAAERSWFERKITFEPFRPLAEYDRKHTFRSLQASVEGYSGTMAINVDSGADIYFFRQGNR